MASSRRTRRAPVASRRSGSARNVETGLVRPLYQGSFCFGAVPLTHRGRLLAACWAGGIRAHASHRSAASLWGLPGGADDVLELTCPRWRRARHPGLVVHETKCFDATDLVNVDSIPVSTVARTLVDLGAVVSKSTVERAVEHALHRELVTVPRLWATVTRLGKQGRNGVGVLRHVLVRRGRSAPTESQMETRLVQMLRHQGLPEPVRQHVVMVDGTFVGRVDLGYPQWRIAIEYQSIEHHAHAEALRHDRRAAERVGRGRLRRPPGNDR